MTACSRIGARTARQPCRAPAALAALLMLLAACCACSEPEPGPSVGGNTNWLLKCSDDADCGSATSCVCGRCSQRCSSAAMCADFPGSACAQAVPAQLQCGGEQPEGVCLLACETDSDCPGELACIEGACVERAAATRCDEHAGALLCSGFDDEALPGWSLSAEPHSTLGTSSRYRHAGASSLEARASGVDTRSRYVGEFPVQRSGTLHLRVWMFVEPDALIDNLHTISIGDVDTGDWGVSLEFFRGEQAVETPTLLPTGEGVAVPKGRWFCVRAEIELSDTAGAVRVWLDEQPAVRLVDIDTLPAAGAHNLTAGIDHSAQTEPASVFFDELLLALDPVSCVP
jgi:hypothetical protein